MLLLGHAKPGDLASVPLVRPELLYLSPVVPALTGNGLAMRTGMVLEALAARYSVSLLVVKLYTSPADGIPEHFARMCRRSVAAPLTGASAQRSWLRFSGPRQAGCLRKF